MPQILFLNIGILCFVERIQYKWPEMEKKSAASYLETISAKLDD